MTDPEPRGIDQLHALLRDLAAEDAPEILERARHRARARAEQLIEDRLVDELLSTAADAAMEPPRREAESKPPSAAEAKPSPEPGPAREARPAAETGPARDARPTPEVGPQPEAGDAWWTYCILWDENAVESASGLEGVEPGSVVEAVCDGQIAALVSRVPLSEYGDERLRQHLEDLEWVERTARRHEKVLEAVLQERTIVPLRLCTLYRDTDGVRRLLREHRTAFRDGLSRVDGCVEWGVKVFADMRAQPNAVPEAGVAERSGSTYLRRRQEERVLAERAGEVRARCVDVVHERIAGLSRASTVNPPQRPEVHGREQAMLLNGAHLVERNRRRELEQAVEGLQEEWCPLGFTVELTGPWPPYNFVSGADGVLS